MISLFNKPVPKYEVMIQPRPLNLLPEVQKQHKQIRQKIQPYLINQGYYS